MKKQVIKNLLTNYVGSGIALVLGFVVVPLLIVKLGKGGFGTTVLAESLIAFLQIFIFSIRMALARYATFAVSRKQPKELEDYLGTGQKILFVFMGFVFAAGIGLSFFFSTIFRVPEDYVYQSGWLFGLVMISFALSIPNATQWAVLYAHQRFDLINISNYGGVILRALSILVFFNVLPQTYCNLVTYGIIYFFMTMVQNLLIHIWAKKIVPQLNISMSNYNPCKAREIMSFGGHSIVGSVSTVLYDNTINILINIYLGPVANAVFAIANRIPSMLKRVFLEPTWSLNPTFADLLARGMSQKLKDLFILYSKGISAILFPISLMIMFYAPVIIQFWVGDEFHDSATAMSILTLSALLSMFLYFRAPVINAYGSLKIPTRVSLLVSVCNIGLGAWLGFAMHLNVLGIAVAALIASVAGSLLFSVIYVARLIDFSVSKYLMDCVLKPLFASLVFIVLPTRLIGSSAGLMGWSGVAALGTLMYLAGSFFLILNLSERAVFKDLLAQVIKRYFGKAAPATSEVSK